MTTVKRFEDLRAWQGSRELVNLIYAASRTSPFDRDFGLRDQIRRAAVSVMSNIAEGFGAGTDAEFMRFLGYARRSVSETQSQAYIALDQEYLDKPAFEAIYSKANEIERQINSLLSYLARSKKSQSLVKEDPPTYEVELPEEE